MYKGLIVASLLLAFSAAGAHAGERAPSSAKLSKLGLSGMKVVSDAQGMTVRGEGLGMGIVGGKFFAMAYTAVGRLQGGAVAGPVRGAQASFGTIEPTTGVNVPIEVSFANVGGGNSIVVTATVFGNVKGFTN
jgi:hypothetical protein